MEILQKKEDPSIETPSSGFTKKNSRFDSGDFEEAKVEETSTGKAMLRVLLTSEPVSKLLSKSVVIP
jgi:hypothetical protein